MRVLAVGVLFFSLQVSMTITSLNVDTKQQVDDDDDVDDNDDDVDQV